MSKLIPRKIKKVCKNGILVYNSECALTDVRFRYKRNTKWKREAIALIVKEEKSELKKIDEWAWELFQEAVKRNRHEFANGMLSFPERRLPANAHKL